MLKRVLIVEDETVLRKHLARWLVRSGYQVAQASTRAQAMDELAQSEFEAMLLDLSLPDGNGLDLLAELGEQRRPAHTVLMTAYSSRECEERAGQLKVDRVVYKPLDIDRFIDSLDLEFVQHSIDAVGKQLPPELDCVLQAP